jgi:hypothetical protein
MDMGKKGVRAGNDPLELVKLIRVLTEDQFDFWITALNRASAAMGARSAKFSHDDRQKTISYWYLLMRLLEIYSTDRNPFEVKKGELWLSAGLVSMKVLSADFRDRFKPETVRRYVFDLKERGLIALEGRGPEAMVQLSASAILALADTIRQWVTTFHDVDRRIRTMGILSRRV